MTAMNKEIRDKRDHAKARLFGITIGQLRRCLKDLADDYPIQVISKAQDVSIQVVLQIAQSERIRYWFHNEDWTKRLSAKKAGYAENAGYRSAVIPTPEEVKERMKEVQSGWNRREREEHNCYKVAPVQPQPFPDKCVGQ
jgi:hypothetical protein